MLMTFEQKGSLVLLSYPSKKITKLFRNNYLLHVHSKFTIYGFLLEQTYANLLDFICAIHKTGLMLMDELLIYLF